MKIEAGKYYRTKGGQVFGPIVRDMSSREWPWHLCDQDGECWLESGRCYSNDYEHSFDLVAEVHVSDTPPDAPLPDIITDQPIKTLRDEFAMKLMEREFLGDKDEAEQLYRAADAMMEARKK